MSRVRLSKHQKRRIIERAKNYCEYCLSPANLSVSPYTVEHIIPQSKDGKTELENLAFCCPGCNGHKYNKTEGIDATTNSLAPLFHPRQQKWHDHFAWSKDCLEVVGITSTGRATINTLKLNRPELQNLRRILFTVGTHPPSHE